MKTTVRQLRYSPSIYIVRTETDHQIGEVYRFDRDGVVYWKHTGALTRRFDTKGAAVDSLLEQERANGNLKPWMETDKGKGKT